MGFIKIESKIGFAELALSSSMAKNRSLKTLEQMKAQNILKKWEHWNNKLWKSINATRWLDKLAAAH